MSLLRRIIRRFRPQHVDPVQQLKGALRTCGDNVSIRLPCVIENAHLVSIGADVSVASYLHIWGNGGVTIGPRSMIASHVAITSATHDPDSPEMYKTLDTAPVVIENDVWIGAHSVVLPGVVVGQHSVIAAGSVVREDVAPYSIVGGVPAKLIRHKQAPTEQRTEVGN